MRLMRAIPVLLLAALCSRADVVLLSNGDRVSGQIEKLAQDKLSFKTEFAGTIQIDWKKVLQIESDKAYDVEVDSGRRIRGKLALAQNAVVVQTADARVPLMLVSVKSVSPPPQSEGALTPLHGTVNVGYNFARGNSNLSNSTASANAHYRTDAYQVTLDLQSLFNSESGQPPSNRYYGNLRYDRYLNARSFWFALGGLEHDEKRSLDLRTNLGGGLGWKLLHDDKNEANLLSGITYVNEQYQDPAPAAPNGSSSEGLMGIDLRNSLVAGIVATHKVSLQPNLVQLGRYRMSVESGVRLPLLSRYIWSLQLFDRYDSRPPVEAKRNDYGAISSFGVTF
jgi:putative salt-induced outer membrane protein YdiY